MLDGDGESFGTVFTFAVVLRGELSDINRLIDFLKNSDLVVAHKEIGQEKMWIKRGLNRD